MDEFYKRGEIQNEQQYRTDHEKFHTQIMEPPGKILEQTAIYTRPTSEEHMLDVMDNSTHEEHLSQLLQTKNNQYKKRLVS